MIIVIKQIQSKPEYGDDHALTLPLGKDSRDSQSLLVSMLDVTPLQKGQSRMTLRIKGYQ